MKHIIFLIISICLLSSCDNKKVQTQEEAPQTLLIYMPWTGNSNPLTSYLRTNIKDFESAIGKNILEGDRVIVCFMETATKALLFELKYVDGTCRRIELDEYQNPEVSTSQWITSLITDVIEYAPAKKYSMIIGSHGLGWLPADDEAISISAKMREQKLMGNDNILITRYFGGTANGYRTDISTLAEGIKNAGIKMQYIMFDACYMSTIEVAYELKESTDYIIATPTEVLGFGFLSADIQKYLVGGATDYTSICDEVYDYFYNSGSPYLTISIIKCSEIDLLAAVMKQINEKYTFDAEKINSVQAMCGYNPRKFYDMKDYVSYLCGDDLELLNNFNNKMNAVVPYGRHTTYYYSAISGSHKINTYSGLAISDLSQNPNTSGKTKTAWYKATH